MAQQYDRKFLQRLAKKVVDGTASAEEKLFLLEYYNLFDKDAEGADMPGVEDIDIINNDLKDSLMHHLDTSSATVVPFYKKTLFRLVSSAAVAAAVIVFVSFFFLFNNIKKLVPLLIPGAL